MSEIDPHIAKIQRILVAVKPIASRIWHAGFDYEQSVQFEASRNDFPVPGLLLYLFTKIIGSGQYGPAEKMRWGVEIDFDGTPIAFQLEKFGLKVYIQVASETQATSLWSELRPRLKSAMQRLEAHLEARARCAIQDGRVTVRNCFSQFDGAYHYFRELAMKSYTRPDLPTEFETDEEGNAHPVSWEFMQGPREGFYCCTAMMDAYFSRLEHVLVLIFPFTNFLPEDGNLLSFIGLQWGDKFKKIFDITSDKSAKHIYDSLFVVKERFRNTLAHGGFEKRGDSVWFHLEEIGAMPASFQRVQESVHFHFIPIGESTFYEVCGLFNEVDQYLDGAVPYGWQYAQSGLDVAFDQQSIADYRMAMKSSSDFKEMIRRRGYLNDMHANMDY